MNDTVFMSQMSGFPDPIFVTPQEQRPELRRGWLKNDNPPGDFMNALRYGARNRHGNPCKCPAMRGKRRCRLHGGKSTGAKTKEGLQRIRKAQWVHGFYSAEWKRYRRKLAAEVLAEMTADLTAEDLKPDPTIQKIRKRLGLKGLGGLVVKVRAVGMHGGKIYT